MHLTRFTFDTSIWPLRAALALAIGVGVCGWCADAGAATWIAPAGGDWASGDNWDGGAAPGDKGTAIFDGTTPGQTGGVITIPSSGRPKNVKFQFDAGAKSYTFSGSYIDNAATNLWIKTASGMNSDQTFTAEYKVGSGFALTAAGAGDLSFDRFTNSNNWSSSVNTAVFDVQNADAVVTIGTFSQSKPFRITKNGAGALVFTGTLDFGYGMWDETTYLSTSLIVNGGTIDVSAATLNLEPRNDFTPVPGETYVIVDYSGATLASNSSFNDVLNLPQGWEVANDAANQQIVLKQVPEPASVMVLFGLAAIGLGRRRSRA